MNNNDKNDILILLKGQVMNKRVKKVMMWTCLSFVFVSSAFSAPKNELTMRFLKVLNLNNSSTIYKKAPGRTQVTPLFIRSNNDGKLDLTMLIAYDKRIESVANQIINKPVTPLVFSVSTMPFVEVNFHPEWLVFEQDGKRWSPSINPDNIDMFPLDEATPFGGQLTETQVHQGIILLPGWFNINKQIKINYKNFRKLCLLK